MTLKKLGVVAIAGQLLLACGARPSLQDQGALFIETQRAGRVYFVYADAYPNENGFEVVGKVRRSGFGTIVPLSGHVDMTVTAPEGQSTIYSEMPLRLRSRPRRTAREADFRFNVEAPQYGSKLLLVYHERSHGK